MILLSSASGSAQEQVFRNVAVAEGARVRVGIHGNVSKECTPGALPEVKVVTPPKNGTLTVSSGKTKAGSLARCPSLEVPARGVFYQPKPRYSGPDEIVYEIRRSDGRKQSITIKLTVGGAPKPAAKEDGVEL
jgi:hypothetical protein